MACYNSTMNILELNRPAIHKMSTSTGRFFEQADVRPYVSNEPYMENRIVGQATLKDPVYRLLKDYDIKGLKFGMSMITKQKDMAKAEKFMDKQAKLVTEEQTISAMAQVYLYLNEEMK